MPLELESACGGNGTCLHFRFELFAHRALAGAAVLSQWPLLKAICPPGPQAAQQRRAIARAGQNLGHVLIHRPLQGGIDQRRQFTRRRAFVLRG